MCTQRRLVVTSASGQPIGRIFKSVAHERCTCSRKIVLWHLHVGLLIVWTVTNMRPAHRSVGIVAQSCKRYWSDKIMNLHTGNLQETFFFYRTKHFTEGGVIGNYAATMSSALRRSFWRLRKLCRRRLGSRSRGYHPVSPRPRAAVSLRSTSSDMRDPYQRKTELRVRNGRSIWPVIPTST
jgi:hypothetical protein